MNTVNDHYFKFTNDEIIEYFVKNLRSDIKCEYVADDIKVPISCKKIFNGIIFDGLCENFFVMFLETKVSIFIYDNEVMFLDEELEFFGNSDVDGCIVYEEAFKHLSHKDFLMLLAKLVNLFKGVRKIEKKQRRMLIQQGDHIKYYYDLTISSRFTPSGMYEFGNIKITVA